jgi:cytochrome c553
MVRGALVAAALLLGAAAPPPGATNCSGCHNSNALPIDGQNAGALSATMLAYRSGERPSTVMGRLMKGLTPEQITAIAAWVSAQK